jgi:hypothetical protein
MGAADAGAGQQAGNGGQNAGNGGQQAGNGGQNTGNGGQQAGNGGQNTGNGGQQAGNGGQSAGNGGDHGHGGGCHDDASHSGSGDVANAGGHTSQPAPTFWTLIESELTQVGVTHQQIQQLEAMWHFA